MDGFQKRRKPQLADVNPNPRILTGTRKSAHETNMQVNAVDPQVIALPSSPDIYHAATLADVSSRGISHFQTKIEIPKDQDFSPASFNSALGDLYPNHQQLSDEVLATCGSRQARVASFLDDFDASFGEIGEKDAAT